MKKKNIIKDVNKQHNRLSIILVSVIVILLAVVVSIGRYNISLAKKDYDDRKITLQKEIDDEQLRTIQIKEYEKYTKTNKFNEEISREQLGMVKENEIVFKSANDR